jgi:ketosteroid isomerase-like protein
MRPVWLAMLIPVCLLVSAGCAPPAAPTPPPTSVPLAPAPPTAAADLVAPVKAWVDAINKGDVDAALEPLADNAEFTAHYLANQAGRNFSGKEQVRPALDYLVSLETKSQVKDCQPKDDRVVCGLSVVDACIAAFGAPDGLAARLEFIYQPDGKAREVSFTLDDPDYSRFLLASDAWGAENRAQEWAKLDPIDSLLGGSIQAKFCQEYAASLKAPPSAADLVAPVKAWVDAINKGDVDAALELLADNALWSAQYTSYEGGGARDSGKEQVRPQFDYLVGLGMKSQLKDCQPQDDRVVCDLSVVYGCIAPFGAPDGLAAKLEFIYQPDGKVREVSLSLLDDPRFEAYSRFLTASEAWAIENRAEEHAKLNPRGTGLGGSLEAKWCKEYAETLK